MLYKTVNGHRAFCNALTLNVAVSNGLFTVTLDFGANTLPGADRWLELGVRTNGSSAAFTTLSPRQQLGYLSPARFVAQLCPSSATVGFRAPSAKDGQNQNE